MLSASAMSRSVVAPARRISSIIGRTFPAARSASLLIAVIASPRALSIWGFPSVPDVLLKLLHLPPDCDTFRFSRAKVSIANSSLQTTGQGAGKSSPVGRTILNFTARGFSAATGAPAGLANLLIAARATGSFSIGVVSFLYELADGFSLPLKLAVRSIMFNLGSTARGSTQATPIGSTSISLAARAAADARGMPASLAIVASSAFARTAGRGVLIGRASVASVSKIVGRAQGVIAGLTKFALVSRSTGTIRQVLQALGGAVAVALRSASLGKGPLGIAGKVSLAWHSNAKGIIAGRPLIAVLLSSIMPATAKFSSALTATAAASFASVSRGSVGAPLPGARRWRYSRRSPAACATPSERLQM